MKNCLIVVNYFSADILSNIINITVKYNFSLVVVDNSCDYNEQKKLETFQKINNVFLTINKSNFGFGKGCQIGVEYAKSIKNFDNFVFINPDIKEIDLTKFDLVLEEFKNNSEAVYLQPIIEDERKENSILGLSKANNFDVVLLNTVFKFILPSAREIVVKIRDIHEEKTKIFIPSGAFFVVKASVFQKINFPTDNFLYFEEWLLVNAIKDLDKYGYIDNRLIVHHQIGYSTGLQYGKGSALMLNYRYKSFKKTVDIIIKNKFINKLSKIMIIIDYYIRATLLKFRSLT